MSKMQVIRKTLHVIYVKYVKYVKYEEYSTRRPV